VTRLVRGRYVEPGGIRGYYIDMRPKARTAAWPPPELEGMAGHRSIGVVQWALGALEHRLATGDDTWLAAARAAADELLGEQERTGPLAGAWLSHEPYPHTFEVTPPWTSAMGQGEAASLLVRIFLATGEDRFAEGAVLALGPLAVPTEEGGVRASLDGRPWPEEFPTTPPSFVLNGGIFAIWGLYDVGVGLGDPGAAQAFAEAVETLAANIHRWDHGWWSRYDLYPHPVMNLASPFYHRLHIEQLRALDEIAPRPELRTIADRWERYWASPLNRVRAVSAKIRFRRAVPR